MKLTDVRLLVDRFDECVRFYTDVIGLKLALRVPEDVYAELEAGGSHEGSDEGADAHRLVIGIYRRELMYDVIGSPYDAGAPRTDFVSIGFRVDDVDASLRELRSRGAEVLTEAHDQAAWGLRVAHLRDPDGNLVEIWHPLPTA